MAMSRKGIFFTLMALLIVAFIFTTERVATTPYTVSRAETDAARTRVTLMNAYMDTFEAHAAASLATAGYFSLQNLSAQVRARHAYINDINASIRYCMLNATNPHNCLNRTQTLDASLDPLITLARTNFSITTTYAIHDIWVTEERPFEVVFWMDISYNISDPFASWRMDNRTVMAIVDVSGIEDPAYAYAVANLTLRQSRNFSNPGHRRMQFTSQTFTSYYVNQSYIANPGTNSQSAFSAGPSVLQRYLGNLTNGSACCGIESVLLIQQINTTLLDPAQTPSIVNWSMVDYLFFSRTRIPAFDCADRESARLAHAAFPDKQFRLDTDHLFNMYNLSSHANYTCDY